QERSGREAGGWRLLLSAPILINFAFFMILSLANGGVQNYSVVALAALHGTPLELAHVALSAYLLMSAGGVLIGGYVVTRTERYDGIAVTMLAASSTAVVPFAFFDLAPFLLVALMALSGLFQGVTMPSRDMLVRAVTPPGSFGKVFGFVTTGFNIGGMISPLIYGWLMDSGNPSAVFVLSAACGAVTILAIVIGRLWSTRAA